MPQTTSNHPVSIEAIARIMIDADALTQQFTKAMTEMADENVRNLCNRFGVSRSCVLIEAARIQAENVVATLNPAAEYQD